MELQLENRRLRDSVQQCKANQRKMYSKWERVMMAVQQVFAPHGSSSSINASFDLSAYQSFMESTSEASRRFFASVETDVREMVSLAHSDLDDTSEDVFQTLLASPKQTGGGPLASYNSFDTFASRITPPFAPPVPKYPALDKETIGGEALSKQSSFELFSTYVSMYGQPVETGKVKKEESSAGKRSAEESSAKDSKRSRSSPFTTLDSTDDPYAVPPTSEHDPLSLDSNAARYNSMDFGVATRMSSMDAGSGFNASDFSLSRLNSIDLNGILGQLTRENSVDNEKRNA